MTAIAAIPGADDQKGLQLAHRIPKTWMHGFRVPDPDDDGFEVVDGGWVVLGWWESKMVRNLSSQRKTSSPGWGR